MEKIKMADTIVPTLQRERIIEYINEGFVLQVIPKSFHYYLPL